MNDKTKRIIIGIIITICIVLVLVYFLGNRSVKEGTISGNHYKVGEMKMACGGSDGHGDYYERGYFITKNADTGKVVCNVSLGTNGIDLLVRSIKEDKEGRIVITIKERTKSEKALNSWPACPNIDITFDKEPVGIVVKNTKNDTFIQFKK